MGHRRPNRKSRVKLTPVRTLPTRLGGPILIEPEVHGDARGFFLETYRKEVFAELGIEDDFVQDNHSRSRRGVVRGMHFQAGMAKHIRCVRGAIFDVLVDIRRGSPTFGQWEGFELNDENHHQLYCPVGFAHGFCVMSVLAEVIYKCTEIYHPEDERTLLWNDPALEIKWPVAGPIISAKDERGLPLSAATTYP